MNGFRSNQISKLVSLSFAALLILSCTSNQASAQRLRELLREGQPETKERRPNNQIEGTIWEYRSTKYESTVKPGEKAPTLKGRMRIEGNAVFDANSKIEVKSRDQRLGTLRSIARGESTEVSTKSREQKRIGEYRKLSNGKTRFDFNDPKSLNGIMIAWPKPDTKGVWLANYKKMDGKKTVGEWLMELRKVED